MNINDIRFSAEKGGYYLDTLTVSSYITETNDKALNIKSDLISGTVLGRYSFKDIVPALRETGNLFLPALVKAPKKKVISENNFKIDISINDLEQFAYILDLPFVFSDDTRIQGNYNYESNKFNLEILSPKCLINKMQFEDCLIKLENRDDKEALLLVNVTQLKNDKTNKIAASFDISGNNIHSKLKWNDRFDQYNGSFDILTKFTEQTGEFPLKTEINFSESKVTFKDFTWNVPVTVLL